MEQVVSFITSPGVVSSIVIVIGALVLWGLLSRVFHRYMKHCKDNDSFEGRKKRVFKTVYVVLKYLLMVVTFFVVLQVNGIDIGAMVAGLGLASVAVGFALQDVLKDAIMGVHILTDRFFSVGDVVVYQGKEGEVISFTPQTTKLRLLADGSTLVISNRNITEIALSSHQVDVDLPLSYEEDVAHVHETLRAVCERISQLENVEECVYKGTQDFQDSAILYKVRFFCNPLNKLETRRQVLKVIQEDLAAAHIEIPYNQLDVHLPAE